MWGSWLWYNGTMLYLSQLEGNAWPANRQNPVHCGNFDVTMETQDRTTHYRLPTMHATYVTEVSSPKKILYFLLSDLVKKTNCENTIIRGWILLVNVTVYGKLDDMQMLFELLALCDMTPSMGSPHKRPVMQSLELWKWIIITIWTVMCI